MSMKHVHLSLFLAILLCLGRVDAFAYDAQIDGIYYTFSFSDAEAEVTYYSDNYYSNSSAYSGNVVIPASVTYYGKPYNVTSIRSSAFSGCTGLTSVTIPESVTSIGSSAFYGCSGLTSINIPEGVTSIGSSAFSGCSGLTSINIPEGVTSIGSSAFYGCSGLTSINIPEGVTSISSYAFRGCSGLASITIPESVTSIGSSAFSGCSGLTSLSIGNGLKTINTNAFENCVSLSKIVIGCGLESVRDNAFKGCNKIASLEYHCKSANGSWFNCKESLVSLTIGDEVESVVGFKGCTNLTSVNVGSGLKTIHSSAFDGCSSLDSFSIGSGVEYIGDNSFRNCSSLSIISISNSVKTLRDNAFWGCSNLTTVSIGSGLETIQNNPFGSCDKLASIVVDKNNPKYDSRNSCNAIIVKESNSLIIGCKGTTIPNSVTSIGGYSFQACKSLTSINIPQGVTSIGDGAFIDCSGLTSITIPEGVTRIGDKAFQGTPWFDNQPDGLIYVGKVAYQYKGTMPNETTINIKDGTVGITDNAFNGCSGLVFVSIPNSVTSIGRGAFEGCSSLTSIDIPEGVTSIGYFAFKGCSSLTSIDIPEGVTRIDVGAFEGCSALSSITFPGSLKTIDGSILYGFNGRRGTSSLKSITVGEGAESFGGFPILENATITLPNSLTTIWSQAFEGCRNCTVRLGTGIKSISDAFYNTDDMTIYIYSFNRPNTAYHCFYWAQNCKSYVPFGRGDAYRSGSSLEGGYYWCSVTEMSYPSLTIGSSGYATYCANKALDFSEVEDVKAYVATDYQASTNTLLLSRVMKVSAGEGIIVVGKPGTYDIPECTTNIVYTNLLCGMDYPNYVSPTDGDYTNLFFTDEQSFLPIKDNTPFFAGSAYLYLPSDCFAGNDTIVNVCFDDVDDTVIIKEGGYIAPNVVTACPGGLGSSFSLDLRNGDSIVGVQFDLQLPEGVSLVTDSKGNYVASLSERKEDHVLSVNKISDNTYRFVAISMNNKAFTGTEGALLNVHVKVDENVALGDYEVKVMNTELTAADMSLINSVNKFSILTVKDAEPGDVNGDMKVSVTDVVSIIDDILNNTPSIFIRKAADVNGDNKVSVTDAVNVIDMILNEGKENHIKGHRQPTVEPQ